MIDLLIVGGGPAGLTAALYGVRAGLSVTVCERETFGGQITHASVVDNYPALPGISGMELGDQLLSQAMNAGAEPVFAAVTAMDRRPDGSFLVTTDDGVLEARAVILAAGASPRPLGLEREQKFLGQGVSYCALCDGAFYADQDVAVVGGGSSACSEALYLSGICRQVTLIHRRTAFRAEPMLVDALEQVPNLRILTPYTVSELLGQDHLEAICIRQADGGETTLPVQGLFVSLGRIPDCGLLDGLAELDEQGYACSDERCLTRTPGLFVAGDCRKKSVRQLTTAISDGTCAALAACRYLGH